MKPKAIHKVQFGWGEKHEYKFNNGYGLMVTRFARDEWEAVVVRYVTPYKEYNTGIVVSYIVSHDLFLPEKYGYINSQEMLDDLINYIKKYNHSKASIDKQILILKNNIRRARYSLGKLNEEDKRDQYFINGNNFLNRQIYKNKQLLKELYIQLKTI